MDEMYEIGQFLAEFEYECCRIWLSGLYGGKVKHELRVQIYELLVQIHELRIEIHELQVQIHELED